MPTVVTYAGRTVHVGDRIGSRTILSLPDARDRWGYRTRLGGYVDARCDCGRKVRLSLHGLLGLRKPSGRAHTCVGAVGPLRERQRAHHAVSRATAAGLLVRPRHCSLCGKEARRIVGHHRNYAHPLAVVWCCEPCHMSEHAQARRSPSQQTAEPADNAA